MYDIQIIKTVNTMSREDLEEFGIQDRTKLVIQTSKVIGKKTLMIKTKREM